jgi:hypothetical protein
MTQPAPPAHPQPLAEARAFRKKRFAEALTWAVIAHVVMGVVAGTITIVVIVSRPKVMFDARQPPSIPARKLEHSIRVKQMQEQVRKPQILQRVVSTAPGAVSLPELPRMEAPDAKKMRDVPIVSSRAGSLLGGLGKEGGGAGRGLGGGSGYSDTKFFGENVRTRAIVILVDVSKSIIQKGVLDAVLTESEQMLGNMNPGTKFNIIAFIDGADAVAPAMVFATQENKKKATDWLHAAKEEAMKQFPQLGQRKGYSGSTPSEALRMGVDMGCDTLFVLVDDYPYLKQGDAQTGVELTTHADEIMDFVKGIEGTYGRQVKINPVMFKPRPNERGEQAIAFYKKIAQTTGGRIRVIKGDE